MLSHDDPRFVPGVGLNDAAYHGRKFADNMPNVVGYVPPPARGPINLTGSPLQTVRTMGPHKSELIRKSRGTQRWYVAYVPFGMRYRHMPPRYTEPFKTEKAALRHALAMLDSRDAFRAEVVKG